MTAVLEHSTHSGIQVLGAVLEIVGRLPGNTER